MFVLKKKESFRNKKRESRGKKCHKKKKLCEWRRSKGKRSHLLHFVYIFYFSFFYLSVFFFAGGLRGEERHIVSEHENTDKKEAKENVITVNLMRGGKEYVSQVQVGLCVCLCSGGIVFVCNKY